MRATVLEGSRRRKAGGTFPDFPEPSYSRCRSPHAACPKTDSRQLLGQGREARGSRMAERERPGAKQGFKVSQRPPPGQAGGRALRSTRTQPGHAGLGSLYLEWDDDHEDLLIFIREDVLNESPAGPDECNRDEQQRPLQTGKERISDADGLPRLPLPVPPHSSLMTSCATRKREGATFRNHLWSEAAHSLLCTPYPPTRAAHLP